MRRFSISLLPVWLALGACWVIPFLVTKHTFPIPSFYSESVAAVCWIAFALAILGTTWGQTVEVPRIVLAPLALIVVLILQLNVAPPLNPFFSFAAIVALLAALVICCFGAWCRRVPDVLDAVAVAIIVGALLTVVIELLQLFRVPNLPSAFFSVTPPGIGRRMHGNLNQPNHVASYLAFALAACFFLAHKRQHLRVVLTGVCVVLLLGMALTVSRVTWVHIVLVGGLAGLAWSAEAQGARRWAKMCAPVAGLVLAYGVCNWLVAYANVLWSLGLQSSLGERMGEGVGARMLLWNHAWHIFLSHPWLGGGWGDYAWNQYVQTDVLGRVEMAMNAHNIVLDLMAKVGVVGLLAVALPFFALLLAACKRRVTPELAFLYAIILVTAAHSMLEYPLHYLYFLLPFAFALGYVDERQLRFPSPNMTWMLVGVFTVCSVVLTGRMWIDYRSVEQLFYSLDDMATALPRYQQSGELLLVPYGNLSIANNAAVTREMAPLLAAIEHQAVRFYPGPGPVQHWAMTLAFQGKTEEAVTQVRRLHDQYWAEYPQQSRSLTSACAKEVEGLEAFCSRLKAEKLLVGAD